HSSVPPEPDRCFNDSTLSTHRPTASSPTATNQFASHSKTAWDEPAGRTFQTQVLKHQRLTKCVPHDQQTHPSSLAPAVAGAGNPGFPRKVPNRPRFRPTLTLG